MEEVPQGRPSSPLLFILGTSSLPNLITEKSEVECDINADDISLHTGNEKADKMQKANSCCRGYEFSKGTMKQSVRASTIWCGLHDFLILILY